jgi:hypothetical protein
MEVNNIRKRMANLKLSDCQSMESYLACLNDCWNRLELQNQRVSAAERLFHVTQGLPEEYDTVVEVIITTGIDYTNAILKITDKYNQLRMEKGGSGGKSLATHESLMYTSHAPSVPESANFIHHHSNNFRGTHFPSRGGGPRFRGGHRGGFQGRNNFHTQNRFSSPAPQPGSNFQSGSRFGSSPASASVPNHAGAGRKNFGQMQCGNCGNFGHSELICRPQPYQHYAAPDTRDRHGNWRG